MNKRERLDAAINGREVDRVPASIWGHFFLDEINLDAFVAATMRFQRQYDWDFIKIHPRASFFVEGFGYRIQPSTVAAVRHTTLSRPVHEPAEWRKLRPVPLGATLMQEQVEAVRRIRAEADKDVPLIMTIFSPLDIADKMTDRDTVLIRRSIEEEPEAFAHALEVITETFVPFVRAVVNEGIDGIFFPTKWMRKGKFSPQEYDAVAGKFDRAILAEVSDLWCNIIHLCESEVDLAGFKDYPAAILHWDDEHPDNPTLLEGLKLTPKAVSGGVSPNTLAQASSADVRKLVARAVEATGGRRLVIAPGCTSHMGTTPAENFQAVRAATYPT